MKSYKYFIVFAVTLLFSSTVFADNELIPLLDIPYVKDGGERQQLNLFLPKGYEKSEKPIPLIIMLHGGGWGKGGDKGRNPGLGGLFVKYGFATATLNRRCVPEFPFPAQIIDTKSAVRWLRAHAKEYNLDTDHFGVWGHSAGGHLGALLGTTGNTREFDQGEYLDQSSVVQAVFDRCGPTDFETWHEGAPRNTFLIPEMFGGTLEEKRDLVRSTSPLHRVSAKAAPMLIVHAIDDIAVPYSQSQKLDEALRKAGVPSELLTLPAGDGGHGSTQFNSDEVKKKMMEFFVKYLNANDE